MTWLYEFSNQHKWMAMENEEAVCDNPDEFPVVDFHIDLKGKSKRRYKIIGRIMQTECELAKIQPIQVFGAGEEVREQIGDDEWCQLCITSTEFGELLPLGDQLISIVLAMHDDVAMAQEFPLIELFLAHGQEEYQWIQGYTSDGIELGQSDTDLYKIIPSEIRYLDHYFSCLEDELQYAAFTEKDKQIIFDEEIRLQAKNIREKKQIQQ